MNNPPNKSLISTQPDAIRLSNAVAGRRHPEDARSTNPSLISKLKKPDDSRSWQEFFDIYHPLIVGVALKAGLTEAEAKDAAQETMITVSKQLPSFQYDPQVGSFKAWLLKTTRWKIKDQFRRRIKGGVTIQPPSSHEHSTSAEERLPDPVVPEQLWETTWQKTIYQAALKRVKKLVKPLHYQVFDLYVHRNWPVEKVMERLKVSQDQIHQVKHRIMAHLKRELGSLENPRSDLSSLSGELVDLEGPGDVRDNT